MTLRRRLMNRGKVNENANRLYLYNYGDECAAITGGWTADNGFTQGDSVFVKSENNMSLKCSFINASLTASTVNEIDTSGYTRLCALISTENSDNQVMNSFFGIAKPNFDMRFWLHKENFPDMDIPQASGITEISLDISADELWFSKNRAVCGIFMYAAYKLSSPVSQHIYQIWLE